MPSREGYEPPPSNPHNRKETRMDNLLLLRKRRLIEADAHRLKLVYDARSVQLTLGLFPSRVSMYLVILQHPAQQHGLGVARCKLHPQTHPHHPAF